MTAPDPRPMGTTGGTTGGTSTTGGGGTTVTTTGGIVAGGVGVRNIVAGIDDVCRLSILSLCPFSLNSLLWLLR